MWSRNISFTNGELHLSGISAAKLAKDFGTPAFFIVSLALALSPMALIISGDAPINLIP
jgi:hypothetical protein